MSLEPGPLPLTSLIPSAPERQLQPQMTHVMPLSVPECRVKTGKDSKLL